MRDWSTSRTSKVQADIVTRNRFGLISEIMPEAPETWKDRVFLTLDVDWACDDILADTASIIEEAGLAATWFITHDTPVLARLRSNPAFELGIHPNFNLLLEGDTRNGANATEVLDRVLDIVHGAKAVRSHSMTQSSTLLEVFKELGLTHDCNHFVPANSGIALRPWRHWNGLVKAPYCWEDDVHCQAPLGGSIQSIACEPGLRIFDFHPIHVFLNTEHMNRYEGTRSIHHDAKALLNHRSESPLGTRALLQKLLKQPPCV